MGSMHKRGDILLAFAADGYWMGPYFFVRDDPKSPDYAQVTCPEEYADTGDLRATTCVRADMLVRPRVLGLTPEADAPDAAMDKGPPINAAQRRLLFALGKARGFDVDGLRALTPNGSISKRSRSQASDVIDRLQGSGGIGIRRQRPGIGVWQADRIDRPPSGLARLLRHGVQRVAVETLQGKRHRGSTRQRLGESHHRRADPHVGEPPGHGQGPPNNGDRSASKGPLNAVHTSLSCEIHVSGDKECTCRFAGHI